MDAIEAVAREYHATKRVPDLAVRRNLVECLRSDDPLVRFMSIGTLSDITGQTKGYRHDAPEALRMVAFPAWAAWAEEPTADGAIAAPQAHTDATEAQP